MSETKSAAEIEDILMSIRRLVGSDRTAAAAPRPQILSRLVVEDRLLLTPELRVRPEAPRPIPMKRPNQAVQSAEPRLTLTAPVAQSAVPPSATPAPRLHMQADTLAWESELGDAAPDLTTLDWSSFTFARRPMAETYAARSRAAERQRPEDEATPGHGPAPVAEAPVAEIPVAKGPLAEPPVTARPVPNAAPVEAVEAEPVAVAQEEDSIFSEDVLRELVRDLIREQLQGELGERITRNIRKLVKAEISRAISVKSLD